MAISATVCSPLMAARATLALNDGEWLRRGRLDKLLLQSQGIFALQVARTQLSGESSFQGPALSSMMSSQHSKPGEIHSCSPNVAITSNISQLPLRERHGIL